MKRLYYSALFCLSACSTAPTASKEQEAISAYLKANTNDPASYEAVRWGKTEAFTRRDSIRRAVSALIKDLATFEANKAEVNRLQSSPAFTDTTRVGTQLTHTYRAKNKLGALVLDSTQFVVYRNGRVVPR